METYDIAVLGGGAAGLMAAVASTEAGHSGLRVLVLEGNARVGKKLLATGNGRCNLSNRHVAPAHYHGDTGRAAALLKRFPPEKVAGQFASMGLLCRELEEGRLYPYSLQASSVLEILRLHLERQRVEVKCERLVTGIHREKEGFLLQTGTGAYRARRVIFATGGLAYPQLGANASGYQLLEKLGHSIVPLRPALVQVRTEPKRAKPLKGMRSHAEATLLADGTPLQKTSGEVQFTEHGLSGICIFELSRLAGQCLEQKNKKVEVALDLMPEYTESQIASLLYQAVERLPTLPSGDLLGGNAEPERGAGAFARCAPTAPQNSWTVFQGTVGDCQQNGEEFPVPRGGAAVVGQRTGYGRRGAARRGRLPDDGIAKMQGRLLNRGIAECGWRLRRV